MSLTPNYLVANLRAEFHKSGASGLWLFLVQCLAALPAAPRSHRGFFRWVKQR